LKKSPVLFLGVAFLLILLGCTTPDFSTINDPIMTPDQMQTELLRLNEINLTVGNGKFDPNEYPISVGIDLRNGKVLVEKFICWDICPEVGAVFLLYMGVGTELECDAALGVPLYSREPIPGRFWGCRPVINWLNLPPRLTG